MKRLTRRQTILVALSAMLLLANIGYWWPRTGQGPRMDRQTGVESYRAEDFIVRAQPLPRAEEESDEPRRDLFRLKSAMVAALRDAPAPVPVKTPQQLEEEAARAELAQLKLVGVVFRGDQRQAFLARGGETFLVQAGAKIGSRFTVEDIAADSIRVKDPASKVTATIPISGK